MHVFIFLFGFFFLCLAVARVGRDRYATIVPCIRAVGMAIAMAAHGNAFATQIGAAFCAIKVSVFFLSFRRINVTAEIREQVSTTLERYHI